MRYKLYGFTGLTSYAFLYLPNCRRTLYRTPIERSVDKLVLVILGVKKGLSPFVNSCFNNRVASIKMELCHPALEQTVPIDAR